MPFNQVFIFFGKDPNTQFWSLKIGKNTNWMAKVFFNFANDAVTLADGVLQQTFTLPIVDDSIDETTETLELSLSSPTNGATLGGVSSTTISIVDNDPVLPGGDPIRSEVEDWTLTNFEREARSFASNQETIRIPSKDLTGSATTTFNGPSGQYLI